MNGSNIPVFIISGFNFLGLYVQCFPQINLSLSLQLNGYYPTLKKKKFNEILTRDCSWSTPATEVVYTIGVHVQSLELLIDKPAK